ncbi:MAG: 50S ribosomal protein L18 [Tenericutes bacterium]|nr:MAG: 50S ribosomal protein L18 [Mycoplasmatota bacterium]
MKKNKQIQRNRRHLRIRTKISGTASKPRLAIYKSNTSIFVQAIDDVAGKTLASASIKGKNVEAAKKIAVTMTANLKSAKITTIVFDRAGFKYHGAIKAFADDLREGGIKF